jgi:hypothetical protein
MKRLRFRHKHRSKRGLIWKLNSYAMKPRRAHPGTSETALLRKARQDEITSHITEWLMSPGLQPPKRKIQVICEPKGAA